jgi:hypothetical protein
VTVSAAQAVVLYHTTNHALRSEKVLTREGLACKLVPVPRHLSSDCGLSLRVARHDVARIRQILRDARVEIAGIHEV